MVSAQGRLDESLSIDREALGLIESLAKDPPYKPDYQDALANQKIHVGLRLVAQGKVGEAERVAREALDLAADLARAYPRQQEPPYYALNVARAFQLLGQIQGQAGLFAEAEESCGAALKAVQEVVDQHDGESVLVLELVDYLLNLVTARNHLGRHGPAEEELLVRAERAMDQLARDFPDLPDVMLRAVRVHHDLGYLYLALDQKERAEESLRRHATILEDLVHKYPDDLGRKEQLAWFRALAPAPLCDPAQALRLADELRRQNGDPTRCDWIVGTARYRQGDWQGCIEALAGPPHENVPGHAIVVYFLAISCGKLGQQDRARAYYDQAVRLSGTDQDIVLQRIRADAERCLGIPSSRP
jgi:tetratricopeptide (TPR) repeat protein